MTEKQLTNKIVAALRAEGAWVMKTHTGARNQQPTQKGLPDIIGHVYGYFFAIEVKLPGKAATRLQKQTLNEIAQGGAIADVAWNIEDAMSIMKDAMEGVA